MAVARLLLQHRCDMLCTSGFMDDIMIFFHNKPYSGMNFATKNRFRLNLLIYRKVGQNSISYQRTLFWTNYFEIIRKLKEEHKFYD